MTLDLQAPADDLARIVTGVRDELLDRTLGMGGRNPGWSPSST